MIPLFRDIFAYHHATNQQLLDAILQREGELPERTFPLFCHVLRAHQIWNARILERPTLAVFGSLRKAECSPLDRLNYRQTLDILDRRAPDETIIYTSSEGIRYATKLADILFHVSNHHSHHRGQIIRDFRQAGLEPLKTDYIFSKRTKET